MNALMVILVLSTSSRGVILQRPTAQVVYPRILEQRSEPDEIVLHIHKDLVLNMKKASVTSQKVRVISFKNEVSFTGFYNGEDVEKNLYEDREKMAVISISSTKSGIHLEGVVGPYTRIEAAPAIERFDSAVMAHVLHDIEKTEMFDKEAFAAEMEKKPHLDERNAAAQLTVPESVLVEVFFVVDTHHHKHFSSKQQLLTYLCIIVATANIRFAETKHPTIQLVLTGLELNQHETFLSTKDKYISGEGTLALFKAYAYANKQLYGNPDSVFLMTGRDVYTINHGTANTLLMGYAYIGSVCTEYFVGLGEDKPGSYSGMHIFTHEMAHVLGASHDGSPPDVNHPNKPDSLGCPWDVGHIMSYINKGPSHHHFSSCSLEQMKYVIRLRGVLCWAVSSNQVYNVTDLYPGMLLTLNAHCQLSLSDERNVTADFTSPVIKQCKVRCRYLKYQETIYLGQRIFLPVLYYMDIDALEYTPCDARKVCIQGYCVMPTKTYVPPTATTSTTTSTTWNTPTATTEDTTSQCICNCTPKPKTSYLPIRGPVQ